MYHILACIEEFRSSERDLVPHRKLLLIVTKIAPTEETASLIQFTAIFLLLGNFIL